MKTSYVRIKATKELMSLVDTKIITNYTVKSLSTHELHQFTADEVEFLPELTQAEAWLMVPNIVESELGDVPPNMIRHHLYQFLGAAGISITEEVKDALRSYVARRLRLPDFDFNKF